MIVFSDQGRREVEARRLAALKAARGDAADSRVSAAVAGLQDAATAALNAQGEDPDGESDPRDAQVWAHLEDAQDAAGEAVRDQAMDAATDAHAAAEGAEKARANGPDGRFTPAGSGIPAPGDPPQAGDFRRPYQSAGHAAPSPGHQPPHAGPVPQGQPQPSDYQRGYLTEGRAATSPAAPARAQHVPHIDLTGSRGALRPIHPSAPMGPGGNHS